MTPGGVSVVNGPVRAWNASSTYHRGRPCSRLDTGFTRQSGKRSAAIVTSLDHSERRRFAEQGAFSGTGSAGSYPCDDREPFRSPSGRNIVLVSNRNGNGDTHVISTAGRGQTDPTRPVGTYHAKPAWAPLQVRERARDHTRAETIPSSAATYGPPASSSRSSIRRSLGLGQTDQRHAAFFVASLPVPLHSGH
jgi:hypothetical protein